MGDSSDCWRCIYCEKLFSSRAARNRHEDLICEPDAPFRPEAEVLLDLLEGE
jgi:hypothetical protein